MGSGHNKKNETKYHELEGYVIAIDLGSTEFRGIVGKKVGNGKIELIAKDSVAGQGINKGCIQNVEDVKYGISRLCKMLENRLNTKLNEGKAPQDRISTEVRRVYISLNGASIDTSNNSASRKMGGNTITRELVEEFDNENRRYPIGNDNELLDIIPQECIIDDEDRPFDQMLGTRCESVTAKYKLVHGKKSLRQNLEDVLGELNLKLAGYVLSTIAEGNVMLTDEEKELGCVLVNYGHTSTGVSVYYKKLLKFTFVMPLGSKMIAKDLTTLKLTENQAKEIKECCACVVDPKRGEYTITMNEREINSSTINEIIARRIQQMLGYVNACIDQSGLKIGSQLEKLILTGGGSKQKGLKTMAMEEIGLEVGRGQLHNNKLVSADKFFDDKNEEQRFSQSLGTIVTATEDCFEYKLEMEPTKKTLFQTFKEMALGTFTEELKE